MNQLYSRLTAKSNIIDVHRRVPILYQTGGDRASGTFDTVVGN